METGGEKTCKDPKKQIIFHANIFARGDEAAFLLLPLVLTPNCAEEFPKSS